MGPAPEGQRNLDRARSILAQRFTSPVVQMLARTSVIPSALTWLGFVISLGAMALIISRHLFAAGFVVLAGSLFDMLDGALARKTGRVTKFGAILDSVLDRFSEAAILLGILVFYTGEQHSAGILLVATTLFISQMVSYTRSRAEAQGLEGRKGLFTRPERVAALVLGLLLSRYSYALFTAVAIIGVFSLITVVERLVRAWRQAKSG